MIKISNNDFMEMLHFAQMMAFLESDSRYYAALAAEIPDVAKVDPGMPGMLMGYDFHITADGPKLIEINNNAGGLYVAGVGWMAQPAHTVLVGRLEERLLSMFAPKWQCIAIMDDKVEEQYMYPEMQAYAALLRGAGRDVVLVSPESVQLAGDHTLQVDHRRVDAIYNRHTDFYLESESVETIRVAWMEQKVALNPHPFSYAMLGDKGRMVAWHRQGFLDDILMDEERSRIRRIVPETRYMCELTPEAAWEKRKKWVFKPAARHGGKGVLLGRAMSRKRFSEMDVASTVMQAYVEPQVIQVDGQAFKSDVRLFMHGSTLVAVAGRIWQGQVANFRDEGSGWVPLHIAG